MRSLLALLGIVALAYSGTAGDETPLAGKALPMPSLAAHGPVTLAGTVLEPDGRPAEGAIVALYLRISDPLDRPARNVLRGRATVNADGAFTFTDVPITECRLLACTAGGIRMLTVPVQSLPDPPVLFLEPAAPIEGIVKNAAGEPVAGAHVRPRPLDAGWGEALETVTDAAGRFRLPAVRATERGLWVQAQGYALATTDAPVPESGPVEIVLQEGVEIGGVVFEADTTRPVAGTVIAVRGAEETRRVLTDGAGEFRLGGLRAGTWTIRLEDAAWSLVQPDLSIALAEGRDAPALELSAVPASRATGHVFDAETHEPLGGVQVSLLPLPGDLPATVTGADGAYTFEGIPVSASPRRLRAQKEGYKPSEATLLGDAAGPDLYMVAQPGLALVTGAVLDEQGEPVADAAVCIHKVGRRLAVAWTGPNGQYEAGGIEAPQEVYVFARKGADAGPPVGPFFLAEGRTDEVNMGLAPGGSVSGRLLGADGQPFTGRITAEPPGRPGLAVGEALAGPGGLFRIAGMPPGNYDLCLQEEKEGSEPMRVKLAEIELESGRHLNGYTLKYADAALLTIAGKVANGKGEPVEATIYARGSGGGGQQAQTGPDGAYVLKELKAGLYDLTAASSVGVPETRERVKAGSEGIDFTLKAFSTIEGQVLDASTDKPITEFEASYVSGEYKPETGILTLVPFQHPEGRFTMSNVAPGKVTVFVHASGYAPAECALADLPAETVKSDVVLRLKPGVKVEGAVTDSDGRPVPDATVRAGTLTAYSGDDGRFVLDALAEEPQKVTVEQPGFRPWENTVTPSASEPAPLAIVLSSGAEVKGVVTLGGQLVPGQTVWAAVGGDGRPQDGVTGPDGAYSLRGLPAGEGHVVVILRLPGGGTQLRTLAFKLDTDASEVRDFAFDAPEDTGTLEGSVSVYGVPAASAVVTFSRDQNGVKDEWEVETTDGRFSLEGLPPGTWSVSVKSATSDGRRYEDTRTVEIKPGEVTRLDADVTRTAPKEEPRKRPSRVPFERA